MVWCYVVVVYAASLVRSLLLLLLMSISMSMSMSISMLMLMLTSLYLFATLQRPCGWSERRGLE